MRLTPCFLAIALLAPACIDDSGDDIEDTTDASADGKADSIAEDSADAAAILALVNDVTLTAQQLHDEAKLSTRAAQNVIARRSTGLIHDLAELDLVPYIGPRSMEALARYAHAALPPVDGTRHAITTYTLAADATWGPLMGPIAPPSFTVPAGVTLTITPGTTIFAARESSLSIEGTLIVEGLRGAPVAFVGEGEDRIAWDGLQVMPGGHLIVDNASVTDATVGITARTGAAETRLRGVSVDDFGFQAVSAEDGTTVDIDGFIATDSDTGEAFRADKGATMTIRNAVVARAHLALANFGTAVVENATFVDNGGNYSLDFIDQQSNTTLRNCIFVGGYIGDADGTLTVDHVLAWKTESTEKLPAATLIQADPRFASDVDYHLTPASPAVNAGAGGPDHDLAGRSRAGAPDLGAYELVQ